MWTSFSWASFLAGILVGAPAGLIITALCVASARNDEPAPLAGKRREPDPDQVDQRPEADSLPWLP